MDSKNEIRTNIFIKSDATTDRQTGGHNDHRIDAHWLDESSPKM